MSVEAIETALEEIDTIRKSAAKNTGLTKEASLQDGNVATAIMVQRDTYFDEPKRVAQDTIKNVIMAGTKFGKMMTEFENYVPHQKS